VSAAPEGVRTAVRRTPALRALSVLSALGVLAALLAGCAGRSGHEEQPSPWSPYVALGDSYTAAPFVAEPQTADGCRRSTDNYPSLVARALQVGVFYDRSCIGAATKDVTGAQGPDITPQIDAVDASTRLVTVGIGGNDLGTATLMLVTCPKVRKKDPAGAPCRDTARKRHVDPFTIGFDVIRDRLAAVLEAVHHRAPDARVLVVGYPDILPAHGRCNTYRVARGDYAYVRSLNQALNRALADAAKQAGDTFVDVAGPSAGHDICSADPWINGPDARPGVGGAYHPLAAEQDAVAGLVLAALGEKDATATP
jgi:lysophospholipase L1-like esterase